MTDAEDTFNSVAQEAFAFLLPKGFIPDAEVQALAVMGLGP